MYQQQTLANSLIKASVDANNKQRLQFIECKEKKAQERVDKMKFLTDVYFEDVNKRLMKAATEGRNMYASVPFYVEHFKVSKELEELGVFIGYPNEIANRWLNHMSDPESKFLSNPSLNWSGLSFEIEQRFEGTKLKYPGEKATDGREIFYIKFNWTRDMRFWCKYRGVFKVHKQDVREKDEFIFQIPQKSLHISDGYTISPDNVSERFDDAERAAKEFDNALVAIGLKPLNFPDEGPPALYFKIDEEGNVFLQARPKPGEKIDLNDLSMEEWDELYKNACESGVSEDKASMLKSYLCGLIEEERKEFEKGFAEVRWSWPGHPSATEPYVCRA
tara:strand:- start:182 stop:1180 length:999 start_codon:yes stop_codon:yes gene_type:complete